MQDLSDGRRTVAKMGRSLARRLTYRRVGILEPVLHAALKNSNVWYGRCLPVLSTSRSFQVGSVDLLALSDKWHRMPNSSDVEILVVPG